MDAPTLTRFVGELNEASGKNQTEDVVRILQKLQAEVIPSEELLKASKAGIAVGKLRSVPSPGVANLAKDLVKKWKEVIEENKRKRKREEGDGVKEEAGKKVKAEPSTSAIVSSNGTPAAMSPDRKPEIKDIKPKVEQPNSGASSSSPPKRPPLSTIDSSRTTPRDSKSDGVAGTLKAEAETGGDESVRDKCVEMIYNALAGDSTAERSVAIEAAVFKQQKSQSGNEYRAKMRSLFLNLKDKGNPGLRNEIVLGYLTAEKLASLSKEDMASESIRAMNEKIANDNLFKAKAVGETQAETDAFKCGRCQQRKCTYYQMQTRSADEPMTNCGNRWKFS
ncbi:hypothetical protein TREMEDRAFT_72529 [Tremella mesenterica DSM 1558]|uniref:uncharacterized protein n=1 Tax=Tremella mesenterica (strain ATCC 24925 / CBS 8224 / DSM 1558 / NBRC 9311 / NRRL Y-6157 / RJB 2259-6 / UBC 559-6) TaxID=578456 RepID=UPI00032CDC08|nr:uncharacterized protein TREMEDRAFT_72529 [Tremella mesenterica DSM 1558]EIW65771.1 hypothetical protein TREMEDRAFT_72529 [Tremella mesenterica DSM 1558]